MELQFISSLFVWKHDDDDDDQMSLNKPRFNTELVFVTCENFVLLKILKRNIRDWSNMSNEIWPNSVH